MIRKKSGVKKVIKKITSITLAISMGIGCLFVPGLSDQTLEVVKADDTKKEKTYDYGRAWQQTLMFYEFQRSGKLTGNERNNWRGDTCLNDGADVGLDLTGGWFDAGDHVKFNMPMSYSASMLAWSYLEYKDTYENTIQNDYMLDQIRWVNDYFIKCHPSKYEYYYQVGDGDIDHQFWAAPELLEIRDQDKHDMSRPSYKVDLEHPGTAVCADTAASLAACSIVFKDIDKEYSEKCLKHAIELYDFAEQTKSDEGYKVGAKGYYASTCFYDELTWGGTWLYRATNDKTYLEKAEATAHMWGGSHFTGRLTGQVWTQCWDDVRYGAMLMIAQDDPSEAGDEFREGIEYNLDFWSTGVIEGNGTGNRINYSPGGEAFLNGYGSLRYATSAAFLAAVYANRKDTSTDERAKKYMDFAKSQADYVLGSTGRSFIVGYDETSPKSPHHRAAHATWRANPDWEPEVSRHTLIGALVGGPTKNDDHYEDIRGDFVMNEVACDYNAGVVGLMGAMYKNYGGTLDASLTAVETPGEEFTMEACNYQVGEDSNGKDYCEIKMRLSNHTGWPARYTTDLKYRYFVNIKEALDEGFKPEDFKVICYYSNRKILVTQLLPWNVESGIYYTEIGLDGSGELKKSYDEAGISYEENGQADTLMYPGGDMECRNDMQLRIEAPGKWDYTKSPSYAEVANTKVDEYVKDTQVSIYEGNKMVAGKEPNKNGEVVVVVPTTQEPATTETQSNPTTETQQNSTTQDNPTTQTQQNPTTQNNPTTQTQQNPTTQNNPTTQTQQNPTTQNNPTTQTQQNPTTQNNPTTQTQSNPTTETTTEIKVTGIILNKISESVLEGESKQLKATILPTNASNKKIKWKSDNEEIAKVDSDGMVYGIKPGETIISATSVDGEKYAKCIVTVKSAVSNKKTELKNIILNTDKMKIKEGMSAILQATPQPTNADDSDIFWKSEDDNIAIVNENGNVTAVSEGSTKIIAYNKDGSIEAVCIVEVQKDTPDTIQVEHVQLQQDEIEMEENENAELEATVLPLNAKNQELIWKSSNPESVVVDESGKIYAKESGYAVITATAENGKYACCLVTVKEKKQKEPEKSDTTESKVPNQSSSQNSAGIQPTTTPSTGIQPTTIQKPLKVKNVKKKYKKKSGKLELSWKKQKGVSGYYIYKYNSKKKKYELYRTVKKNKTTIKKLKKGKKYYFKVAAFRYENGAIVKGDMSKTVKVKIKKKNS